MKHRVNLLISGRVQGVFFRASTLAKARKLSLDGWVKNLADGRVEIMAQGERAMLTQFVDWCRQGPAKARVDRIEIIELAADDGLSSFTIL